MLFDAVLLLSFGGPEGPDQVRRSWRTSPGAAACRPQRLDEVAEHYLHFGGVSPINGINRALTVQLRSELVDSGLDVPVYFGNRNWEPYVEEAVAAMRDNGIRRAAVFTTSAWSGYSSCTPYVEDIARARRAVGAGGTGAGQAAALLRPSAVCRDVRRSHRLRRRHPARRSAR